MSASSRLSGGWWLREPCGRRRLEKSSQPVRARRRSSAVALDGAVGPAAEQGADEALGFAVRARRVGAGAQVFDPERLAGERVHDQRRRRSRCRSSPARCGSRCARRRKPTALVAFSSSSTDPAASGAPVAVDAVARPAGPAKFLDAGVQELAGAAALVALSGLSRLEPGEPRRSALPSDAAIARPRSPPPAPRECGGQSSAAPRSDRAAPPPRPCGSNEATWRACARSRRRPRPPA